MPRQSRYELAGKHILPFDDQKVAAMHQPTFRPRALPPLAVPGKLGRRGFTLVELLVVMAIIGIILSLVLIAGMDAANRANERATQSLITKLEQGLNDRLEALLQNQPAPNYTHGYLAAIYGSNYTLPSLTQVNNTALPNPAVTQTQRAQVIALYDYIKAEMPDVFYVQSTAPGTSGYPLNFAGVPILVAAKSQAAQVNYVLPLGNSLPGPYTSNNLNYGDGNTTSPTLGFAGSGIYGAAYEVAAGLYKGLGYLPAGCDGVDNDSDGFIDNWNEGVDTTNSALVTVRLQNHTHVTARAEMLYALLVSGTGPLGSVYSPDDFTDREVQDTDNDGMPEFIDAWGQPLQFFRWPLFYHSDLARGQIILPDATTAGTYDLWPPYSDPTNPTNTTFGMFQEREQDPLDVNQQLVAPGWWSSVGTGGIAANGSFPSTLVPYTTSAPTNASAGAQAFQALFHTLCEPCPSLSPPGQGAYWDRGGTYGYRAFYSKFLILSGGQDRAPGVFLYSDAALTANLTNASQMLIANENNALPFSAGSRSTMDVADFTSSYQLSTTTISSVSSGDPTNPSSYDLQQNGQDDISNHNLLAGGAIGGSG
jgi:prepilin-type N-terminal cleavage/methylation domain-containing protein